jgi:hypothetical protein
LRFLQPQGSIEVLSILNKEKSIHSHITMKQLGPYKKYIIAAAVIQSIIVVIVGYVLFKSMVEKDPMEHKAQEKPGIEEPLKGNN